MRKPRIEKPKVRGYMISSLRAHKKKLKVTKTHHRKKR